MKVNIKTYLSYKLSSEHGYTSLCMISRSRTLSLNHVRPDYIKICLRDMYTEGLTKPELAELKVKNVDLENGFVTVVSGPDPRKVKLSDDTIEDLGNLFRRAVRIHPDIYVFPEECSDDDEMFYMRARAVNILGNGGSVNDLLEQFGRKNMDALFREAGFSEFSESFMQNLYEIDDPDFDPEDYVCTDLI